MTRHVPMLGLGLCLLLAAAAQDEPVDIALKVKNLGSKETMAELEKEFAALEGVEKAQVRFISQIVNVRVKGGGRVKLSEILGVIEKVGGGKGMELQEKGTLIRGRVRISLGSADKLEEAAAAAAKISNVDSCKAEEGRLDLLAKPGKGVRLDDVTKDLKPFGFADLEWGYAPPEGSGPKRFGRAVDVFGGGDSGAGPSKGLKGWSLGPAVPKRSSEVAPAVAVGKWLVCVDGTNDDCYGAVQQSDGKLSEWRTLSSWGYGGVNHGSGSVAFGNFAFNVGISGYVRRLRAQGDSVSRWEFPVPGDKIDPKNDRPREMVWGGAAGTSTGGKAFLYYIGGFEYKGGLGKDPSSLDVVYVAEVTSGAGLTAWKATTPLPYPAMAPCGVGHNGYVYLLGGNTKFTSPSGCHKEIHSAKVNPDGSLDRWTHVGNLPRAAEGVVGFAYKDYLYALGGKDGRCFAECFRAPIKEGGRIGGWQPQPSLPQPAGIVPHGIIGNHVYVVGMLNSDKSAPVFISEIN